MSSTVLPALPVGGKVTQQLIKHLPDALLKASSSSSRSFRKVQSPDIRMSKQRFGVANSFESTASKGSEMSDFVDTSRYRNSYKHNLCLDMLEEGFHQAFCELFNLLERQKEIFENGSMNVSETKVILLKDEYDKLDMLREYLIVAEASKRKGRMDQVYQAQLTLAQHFEKTKDYWLADYFCASCLKTSVHVRGDGRRTEAEAHNNMGLAAERRKSYDEAVELLETFYNLSKDKTWETEDYDSLHQNACKSLQRVYTAIAEQIEEANSDEAIEYLLKAYEMAKEGGNEKQIGQAGYRLGHAYEQHEDPETAIMYFNGYLEICKSLKDDIGKGEACQALARAHHQQGNVNHAIEYLQLFLDVAERSQKKEAQGAACNGLGEMYNSLGEYNQAAYYFKRSYNISRDLSLVDSTEATRTEYGMALAHDFFKRFSQTAAKNTKATLDYTVAWKDLRIREGETDDAKKDSTETNGEDFDSMSKQTTDLDDYSPLINNISDVS